MYISIKIKVQKWKKMKKWKNNYFGLLYVTENGYVTVLLIHIYTVLHIISLLTGRYELNKLTSFPMCGFIAQLVEHRISIAKVTGSNPVETLIFSGFFFPIA